MTLILDTDDDILIAANAAEMARQLVGLLDDEPDDETLIRLAAAVLGCDYLDIILTRITNP